ncbi:MAG: exodeoxyribonuclease VII small subunit [Elusimicrobiales bacterium]|jgi:exodeoxyribonuclease VII small subunit|nr:exodeoxyribonuclease VII small subunit [Elusimicrobiales bacterium]NLH39608.1 exodeoxyribonuclease VII small subunit [Elusimicrobiota bacterium]
MKEWKNENFELKLKRLEEIVSILENDEVSLDESLKLFEEGVSISKELNDKLIEVKGKIEVIKKDAEGKIKLEDFDDEI